MNYAGLLLVSATFLAAANAIWDGNRANIQDFPYLVTIESKTNIQEYCQGAIINANWIVTSNQRCASRPANELQVRSGSDEYQLLGSYHNVDKVIQHPGYNKTQEISLNDVALMHVFEPFHLDGRPRRKIDMFNIGEKVPVGKSAKVVGFGSVRKFEYPQFLQEIDATILDFAKCNKTYENFRNQVPEGFLCAGYDEREGHKPCYGDEGAPLVVDGRLAGVVSRILFCDKAGYPVMFTEIEKYRHWIDQQLDQFKSLPSAPHPPTDMPRPVFVQPQPPVNQQRRNGAAYSTTLHPLILLLVLPFGFMLKM